MEKALTVCMAECREGGSRGRCEDCATIEALLTKVRVAREE